MLTAVTIDFWGTLTLDGPSRDDQGYKRQRVADFEPILRRAGVTVDPREIEAAYAAGGQVLARVWRTSRDVPVARHVTAILEALDPELPGRLAPDVLDELVAVYCRPALAVPPTMDRDAAAVLDELAGRGIGLAVVSNTMRTPGETLRGLLDRVGLLAPFKTLTFSDECGVRKPDPEIFHLTLRQLGAAPDEAVHVGDDPVLDVEGARDAGMRVIQVAPAGRGAAPVKPDAVVNGLGELPAVLARLAR
jgi:putative hydrolase of the HAD superfamily